MHDIDWYNRIKECAAYIKNQAISHPVEIGLVLGTGLGDVKEDLIIQHTISYSDLPYFPTSTVPGHAGQLIFGVYKGKRICCLDGRFHYYEGYSTKELTFPIRVLKELGVNQLIITNVAGGLNPHYKAGDIVVVRDHINLHPDHPLRGPNDDRLGIRFPDMKSAYAPALIKIAQESLVKHGLTPHSGVYVGLQGPSLETPAEYNYLRIIGGDLVGMSTVPEVIVARHADINVVVLSMVSNVCYPIHTITETTLEEVIAVAQLAAPKLRQIVLDIIAQIDP